MSSSLQIRVEANLNLEHLKKEFLHQGAAELVGSRVAGQGFGSGRRTCGQDNR